MGICVSFIDGSSTRVIHSAEKLKKIKILKLNGSRLANESPRSRNDYDLVMAAVSIYGASLKHASARLRDDYNVVKTAVSSFGPALIYASKRLKNNVKLAEIAIKNIPYSIIFASPRIRAMRKTVDLAKSLGFKFTAKDGLRVYTTGSGDGDGDGDDNNTCVICNDEAPTEILLPCAHMVSCNECTQKYIKTNDTCPICRSIIFSILNNMKNLSDTVPLYVSS